MKKLNQRTAAIAGFVLVACFTVSGCKSATTPPTPRDALIQFVEAVNEGDEAKLFAAVEANESQKDFFRTLLQFVNAATEFRDAFIKAYGEQAWKDFQDDSKAPKDGNAKLTISDPKEAIAKIKQLTFDERANEAFCPGLDNPAKKVHFIKVKDGWRIDASGEMPPEAELQKLLKQTKLAIEAVRKYKKAIGRPGIKGEDIDAELGRELTKIITGIELPMPHRFDINKF